MENFSETDDSISKLDGIENFSPFIDTIFTSWNDNDIIHSCLDLFLSIVKFDVFKASKLSDQEEVRISLVCSDEFIKTLCQTMTNKEYEIRRKGLHLFTKVTFFDPKLWDTFYKSAVLDVIIPILKKTNDSETKKDIIVSLTNMLWENDYILEEIFKHKQLISLLFESINESDFDLSIKTLDLLNLVVKQCNREQAFRLMKLKIPDCIKEWLIKFKSRVEMIVVVLEITYFLLDANHSQNLSDNLIAVAFQDICMDELEELLYSENQDVVEKTRFIIDKFYKFEDDWEDANVAIDDNLF